MITALRRRAEHGGAAVEIMGAGLEPVHDLLQLDLYEAIPR